MKRPDGTLTLVAVLLVLLLLRASRGLFPYGEEPPAFSANKPGFVTIYLGSGFRKSGFCHFFDGVSVLDVTRMAGEKLSAKVLASREANAPLHNGEALAISFENSKVIEVQRYFLPASQCITLGIPLHPDIITANGWQALPGIGPVLARRIVDDRQKNGDFGNLEALKRVRGVGPHTLRGIRKFFEK